MVKELQYTCTLNIEYIAIVKCLIVKCLKGAEGDEAVETLRGDGVPDLSVEMRVSDSDILGQVPCQVDHGNDTADLWNGIETQKLRSQKYSTQEIQ